MSNRGRPREFSNAAAKQKAYRERKNAQSKELELAFVIMDELKQSELALRKSWDYQVGLGRKPTIVYQENSVTGWRWMAFHVDGNFWSVWNPMLFRWLMVRGGLKKTGSILLQGIYELLPLSQDDGVVQS